MRQAMTRMRFPLVAAVCGALALASCETINLSKSNDEKKAARQKAKKKVNVPFANQLDPVERGMVEDFERTAAEDAEASHSKVFGL